MRRPLWALLFFAVSGGVALATPLSSCRPLDVSDLTGMPAMVPRIPLSVSGDGKLLSFSVAGQPLPPGGEVDYTAAGASLAEGRTELGLRVVTTDGIRIELGIPTAVRAWGGVWAPDGRTLAYYADEGGPLALWTWNRESGSRRRVSLLSPRPFFGFETPEFSPDGRGVLLKTVAAPSARAEPSPGGRPFRTTAEGADVAVYGAAVRPEPAAYNSDRFLAHLDLVDVHTGTSHRIASAQKILWYRFSPDGRHLAFTTWATFEGGQPRYQISIVDLDTQRTRLIRSDAAMVYGNNLNWSPDSKRLAFVPNGVNAGDGVYVYEVRQATWSHLPVEASAYRGPPLWSPDGHHIYKLGRSGRIWRIDVDRSKATLVASLPDIDLTQVVRSPQGLTVWQRGDQIYAVGRDRKLNEVVIVGVNERARRASVISRQAGDLSGAAPIGIPGTATFVFGGASRLSSDNYLAVDTRLGQFRQISRFGIDIPRDCLGQTRVLRWHGLDGRAHSTALLLPPDWRPGRRLPLVVWIYGGDQGSDHADSFGLAGSAAAFNMHVLSTRGFAVAYPDAPVGVGTVGNDVTSAVVATVDHLVTEGIVDRDKLAIMGQSFGAFSALSVISRTRIFKAAVLSAAVVHPDLLAHYVAMRPDGSAPNISWLQTGQAQLRADPWRDSAAYRENSPIWRFDQIETPVLLTQGSLDGDLVSPDAIYTGLKSLGKPVEYRVYRDEGHVLEQPANVSDFWARRLEFLSENLGLPAFENVGKN